MSSVPGAGPGSTAWRVVALVSVLVLLLQASTVQAAVQVSAQDIANALRSNNASLWLDVLRIADLKNTLQPPPARYAAFVPTDAALTSFLRRMGLSMRDLEARPALAKHLVAQHLVLGLPADAQAQLLQGKLAAVPTVATEPGRLYTGLQVQLSQPQQQQQQQQPQQQQQWWGLPRMPQVRVRDALDQEATSTNMVRLDANKTAVFIDRVLASGHYYPDFASMCKHRGQAAAAMCEALTKSGVLPDPSSPRFPNTVFFPGSAAFARVQIQPQALPQADAARLVRYHVVPGLHAFPDFAGSFDTLLPGAKLQVVVDRPPAKGLTYSNSSAYVVPADQQRVPVVVYNVFVGQAVVQGIPSVLLPPGFKAPAEPANSKPAAPATAGTAAAAGGDGGGSSGAGQRAKTQQGRLLLGFREAVAAALRLKGHHVAAEPDGNTPTNLQSHHQHQHKHRQQHRQHHQHQHQQQQEQQQQQQHRQKQHHQQQQQQQPSRRLLGSFPELTKVTLPFNAAETDIREQVRTMGREREDRWQ